MPKTKKKKDAKRMENMNRRGIFDFEEQISAPKKKIVPKKSKKNVDDDYYIGAKKTETISKKKIKRIKKEKIKEKKTKEKELQEIQKEQERARNERIKRSRQARLSEKQIKRNKIIKGTVQIILLLVVIVVLLVFLMLSPIFNIKNIEVEQNEQISTEQILSLSKIEKDVNMFKIPIMETIDAIKENPYVKSVEIKRKFPDTIKIIVKERQATFMLEHGSSYAYIDNQGYILEISANTKEGIPKMKGYITEEEKILPGNRLELEDLEKLNTVLKIVSAAKNNELYDIITTINIEDKDDYSLYLESKGKTVYLGNCTNIDTRMLYVKVILEKEKDHEGEIFVNMDLNEKNPFFREKV